MLAVLLISAAISEPANNEVRAGERDAMILLVNASGEATAGTSELLAAAAPILERSTTFELLSPERAGLDFTQMSRCTEHRLGCWLRHIDLRARDSDRRVHLLILGIDRVRDKNSLRIGALYFPSEAASDLANKDDAAAEQTFLAGASNIEARALPLDDPRALSGYFAQLFEVELRPAFERAHAFRALGEVDLRGMRAGLSVELDGTAIGVTKAEHTRITELRTGHRKLALRDPFDQKLVYETAVDVAAGTSVAVAVPVVAPPRDDSAARAIFWSGTGMAIAGLTTALIGWNVNTAPAAEACSGAGCMEVVESRFTRFCDLSNGARADCSLIDSTRIVPFGFALAIGGATWALGTKLFRELEPWIVAVIGVAAGASAYALGLVLE